MCDENVNQMCSRDVEFVSSWYMKVVRPDEGECQMGFGKLSFGGKGTLQQC